MATPMDVTNIIIETPRLILRPWRASDLQDFFDYASTDGVGQMAGWLPHEDLERTRRVLNAILEEKQYFALELKENGRVIGSLGFEERDEDLGIPADLRGHEIGYDLSKAYWGRGLMPEAVKALADYCFLRLNMDYLALGFYLWNSQSRRVAEKCGFRFLKDIPDRTNFGTPETTRIFIRYKEEEP